MKKYLYDNIRLCATIVSDVHMDKNVKSIKERMRVFTKAIRCSADSKSDVFITVGDTTSMGMPHNWELVRECFKKAGKCAENVIFTIGNHDCWYDTEEDEYGHALAEYFSAVKDISGRTLDKAYHSTKTKGYFFICMGNEKDMDDDAYISDAQLEWLEEELARATADGKPAFVFCHQSLNGRHGLPRTWDAKEDPNRPFEEGGVGAQSEQIEKILKKFKNVFYFSGHSHMALCGEVMQKKEGYASYQCENGLHRFNFPTLTRPNHHGELRKTGIGIQLEVYDNKVILRPVNCKWGTAVKSVKMKDSKPYCEIEIV